MSVVVLQYVFMVVLRQGSIGETLPGLFSDPLCKRFETGSVVPSSVAENGVIPLKLFPCFSANHYSSSSSNKDASISMFGSYGSSGVF